MKIWHIEEGSAKFICDETRPIKLTDLPSVDWESAVRVVADSEDEALYLARLYDFDLIGADNVDYPNTGKIVALKATEESEHYFWCFEGHFAVVFDRDHEEVNRYQMGANSTAKRFVKEANSALKNWVTMKVTAMDWHNSEEDLEQVLNRYLDNNFTHEQLKQEEAFIDYILEMLYRITYLRKKSGRIPEATDVPSGRAGSKPTGLS